MNVRQLRDVEIDAVIDVLVDAFAAYPVMRFVLGSRAEASRDLLALFRFFATARFLRKDPVLGVGSAGTLSGVALVSDPANVSPPELSPIREQTWTVIGAEARARYETYGHTAASVLVDRPRLHLNVLGVRAIDRGTGLSRRLLEYVQRLAREHPSAEGVSLTTEDPANVGLYEHLGYQLTGEASVTNQLVTWGMFRPN
jgi:GNAT superfamily N-acetyltransferase